MPIVETFARIQEAIKSLIYLFFLRNFYYWQKYNLQRYLFWGGNAYMYVIQGDSKNHTCSVLLLVQW